MRVPFAAPPDRAIQHPAVDATELADETPRRKHVARLALMLFVASIPTENGVLVAALGSLSRVFGMLALVLVLWAAVSRHGLRLRTPSLWLVCAGLFGAWQLATYYWSAVPLVSLSNAFTFAQLLVLSWLVHEACRNADELASLMQAFVIGAYILIGSVAVRVIGSTDMGFRDLGAFNANNFAMVASLAIPMAWFLQSRDWRAGASSRRPLPLRILNSAYPVAALAAVVLGASRGGLFVMLTCLLIVPLTIHRLAWWRRLLLAAMLAASTTVLALVAPTVFPDVQASIERLSGASEELTSGTLTGRTTIWSHGMEMLEAAPIFGSGAGSFAYLHHRLTGEFKSAHNAFLAVAVGSGLVGLTLFVALIVLAFVSALHSNREVRPYLLVLLAALVVAMLPANSQNDKFLWFVLALAGSQAPIYLVSRTRPQRG